jgi:dihydrofolate reductase
VRQIKSNFLISLDGVVDSPDEWHFPYFDEEMGAAVGAGFATADALLMGRVLYEEWAAYWPEHADEPFGDVMNSIKKYGRRVRRSPSRPELDDGGVTWTSTPSRR